jgi:hypothetical protein
MGLGYIYASFWIAATAAKFKKIPFLFGTDAYDFQPEMDADGKSLLRFGYYRASFG